MRCRKVKKLLPLHEDGGLPARTAEMIERHLADCSECRREARELSDALGVLRAVPRVRPAPEFKRAVIAAVRREAVRTRQGAREWVLAWQPVFATVAVASCVLLGGVAVWLHGKHTPTVTPVAELQEPVLVAESLEPADASPVAEEAEQVVADERVAARPSPRPESYILASRPPYLRPEKKTATFEPVREAPEREPAKHEAQGQPTLAGDIAAVAIASEAVKSILIGEEGKSEGPDGLALSVAGMLLSEPGVAASGAAAAEGVDVARL
jgi:hypothetical protein